MPQCHKEAIDFGRPKKRMTGMLISTFFLRYFYILIDAKSMYIPLHLPLSLMRNSVVNSEIITHEKIFWMTRHQWKRQRPDLKVLLKKK